MRFSTPRLIVWAVMACVLVVVAIGAYLRFGRVDHFDGSEYIGHQPTAEGGWKCPDGYADTGSSDLTRQCRRKAESHKMQKHFRRSQIKAKRKCGERPATTGECASWKCKKTGDTSTWQCSSKTPAAAPAATPASAPVPAACKCSSGLTRRTVSGNVGCYKQETVQRRYGNDKVWKYVGRCA